MWYKDGNILQETNQQEVVEVQHSTSVKTTIFKHIKLKADLSDNDNLYF